LANKRRGEPPIPPNHESLMSEEQLDGLKRLETFGWHLHLIRRPKFAPIEVVLQHSDGHFGVLNELGELDHDAPPAMRAEASEPAVAEPVQKQDPWSNANDDGDIELREPAPAIEPATVNKEPVPTQSGNGKRPPKVLV